MHDFSIWKENKCSFCGFDATVTPVVVQKQFLQPSYQESVSTGDIEDSYIGVLKSAEDSHAHLGDGKL